MNKRLCIVTGSRAEYGLLKTLLRDLKQDKYFEVDLVVTGSHLESRFGDTGIEIEKDEIPIFRKIQAPIPSTSSSNVVKSMSRVLLGFNDYLEDVKPDLVLVLGDRYELLSIANASTIHRIPIGHIHGGELTVGSFDDSIRNSITKLSQIHFTSHPAYSRRVIQMGEDPSKVFCVGALAYDSIRNSREYSKYQIESELGIVFKERILIVTLHPETLNPENSLININILLKALSSETNTSFIFTGSNADPEGDVINEHVSKFANERNNCVFTPSLGSDLYYSLLRISNGMIGNSSSGIIESPFFKKPVINLGERQLGRIQARNVLNCSFDVKEISGAIRKLFDPNFIEQVRETTNPYDRGSATEQICNILKELDFNSLTKKVFHDL